MHMTSLPGLSSAFLVTVVLALFVGCHSETTRQLILPGRDPMPNPVTSGPAQTRPRDLGSGSFRDPSIHVGKVTAPHMFASGVGLEAFTIITQASLPSNEVLHARIADYDMAKYRFVRFEGRTSDCDYDVNLPVPGKPRGGSRSIVPVHFRFGLQTFYHDLSEQMAAHNVIALFDSRLDRDQIVILFGALTRSCYIYHAIGIQPLSADSGEPAVGTGALPEPR